MFLNLLDRSLVHISINLKLFSKLKFNFPNFYSFVWLLGRFCVSVTLCDVLLKENIIQELWLVID